MDQLSRRTINATHIPILVMALLLAGCSNSVETGDEQVDMTLIDTRTEPPSKVRLFFQVHTAELDRISVFDQPEFEIYENNTRISELESQAQVRRERGEFLYSSVLLLDLSGSVLNNEDLPVIRESASSFIERTIPGRGDDLHGTREMAIYWFDGEESIHRLVPFTESRDSLLAGIDSIDEDISDDMSTNLNGAVIQGLERMDSRLEQLTAESDIAIAGSLVIFTDGTDQASRVNEADALDAVHNAHAGQSVFTIGVGGEIDEQSLSQFGKDGFEMATDFEELKESFLNVAERLERMANSFYVLEYCSPKRAGEHSLRVVALYEDLFSQLDTSFSAEGFTGGCTID